MDMIRPVFTEGCLGTMAVAAAAGKAPFRDRDLYVVCISADHKIAASGACSHYVGYAVDILKDAEGKPLGGAILASASGSGAVHCVMANPQTHAIEPRVIFTKTLGTDVCGVGAYNPN